MAPRRTSEVSDLPTLRKVLPQRPAEEEEVEQLREDLRRMGCAGLLDVPWGFREETLIRDLIGEPPNQYRRTLRAHPESWTKEVWQKLYGFRKGGSGLTSRKDDFAKDEFAGRIDAKEGFSVADCKDSRFRAVLAFLIPIFYPEKPTRVTVTWANTIFGAFRGKRAVDWSALMEDLIAKLVKTLPKAKGTPLSSYIAHLYRQEDLLDPEESRSWEAQEKIWKYGDTDSEAGSEDADPEIPDPASPLRSSGEVTPAVSSRVGVKRKTTPRTPEGERKGVRAKLSEIEGMGDPESPCTRIVVAAREALHHISVRDSILDSISNMVGNPPRSMLVESVRAALDKSSRIRELEETEERLTREAVSLMEKVKDQTRRASEMSKRATDSARAIAHVREAMALPADVVNKARLFDDKLSQEEPLSRNKIIRFLVDQAATMEQSLEEMRTLADNLIPDEHPSSGKARGTQFPDRPGLSSTPEPGSSSQSGKLKRKTVMVSESDTEEEEEPPEEARVEGSKRKDVADPDQELEEPIFKMPKPRPKYTTTPSTSSARRKSEGGGSPTGSVLEETRVPDPRRSSTPSPVVSGKAIRGSTPPSSGQRQKLRSQARTSDSAAE